MRRLLFRLLSVGLAAVVCLWLGRGIGQWQMVGVWAIAMAVVCALAALLLRTTKAGEINWKNYVAGWVLGWGFSIGRGKLVPIVLASWAVWVLIAIGVATRGRPEYAAETVPEIPTVHGASMWLIASWAVDVAALLYLLGLLFKRFDARSSATRSQLVIVAIVLVLIGGSVGFWLADRPRTALLIAGGPPLALGVIFGAFALVIVTVGRKARWN